MRIVIGEDEALFREGLVLLLERYGLSVAGVAGDAEELVRVAMEQQPDLVLTDIRMPPQHADDGLQAALAIRAASAGAGAGAGTAVMVLSQHVNRRYARELLADRPAGVGYLLKQRVADIEMFVRDLEQVAAGGTVLDPEVVSTMLTRARSQDAGLDGLTPREAEVLALLAQGRSNAAAARELRVSERAVVNHISRVYDKLGLVVSDDDHRRVLAVIRYLHR